MAHSSITPMIYYGVIAFNTKIICEVNAYEDSNIHRNNKHYEYNNRGEKKEKKYIRASKKILKKIEIGEIRRPDGMGTLISGTYSYNYIHGYEYYNNTINYPLLESLESLVFLCVLPLYQSNPNVTSNEREIAFNFLNSIRRDFLTSFAEKLQYLYSHQFINNIAVIINSPKNNNEYQLNIKDENICSNLHLLSHIMIQRMHGNYKNEFEYKPLEIDDDDDTLNHQQQQTEHDPQAEDLRLPHELGDEFINIPTPNSRSGITTATTNSQSSDSFVGVSISAPSINNKNAVTPSGYGAVATPMNIDDDTASQKSRINDFMESIVDVKQHLQQKIKASMSVSSLKSFGTTAQSEDKFENYENMPLIGSTTSLYGGQYSRDYMSTSDDVPFITRHRKKFAIIIAILVIVYVIIAMFCGWNVAECASE